MKQPLPQHYDAAAAQARYSPQWDEANYARADPAKLGPVFSVVLPPPNVTGSLHMGHALNGTVQDVMARYRRMDGYNVLWTPGVDHASIAVHWLVERKLREEGTSRQELGREAFMERAWAFKEASAKAILGQQKQMALSCDWERLCFTLDEGPSNAVREAFCRLYEDGLIYRAERLVNWDPISQTSVSDLEVVHDENVRGTLYNFVYPLADAPEGDGVPTAAQAESAPDGSADEAGAPATGLEVATTRPETMLGDTAVAVHPEDPRFAHLIGKYVRHPLTGKLLPIIGDAELVDIGFGTGAVKITPAHDANDFAVGERHKLEMVTIFNLDGTLNDACGAFAGLDALAARKAVMAKLEELGLARETTPHRMSVGRSERSGAVLLPMLSTQWFVKAKPLARPAMAAVQHGATRFVPSAWENTYFSWLGDIRDWCVSRQLWWGHRIPAYYCNSCDAVQVERSLPESCKKCGHASLRQDEDVLDTWFSSALWPFSTQGWPEQTASLQRYYPTQVLVTSFDIIFFWVARMMMLGLYFTGRVPFADVYIHALIRDAKGEKMSKTKGNVVDPLTMVERYGLDAFRFTLTAFAGQGRDVRWDEARAAGYGKFLNKVWQAFRFSCAQLETQDGSQRVVPQVAAEALAPFDLWLRARLDVAVAATREALDAYKFNEAAQAIYQFVWNELCDWYLEVAKTILYDAAASESSKDAVRRTLLDTFAVLARLMHPITPYFGEELYQQLKERDVHFAASEAGQAASVMVAPFPQAQGAARTPATQAALLEANFIAEVVGALRRVRAEFGINPKQAIDVHVQAKEPAHAGYLRSSSRIIQVLARAQVTLLEASAAAPAKAVTELVQGCRIYVPLEGVVDVAAERARLQKEIDRANQDLQRILAQLGKADFVARAPAEVVAEKRATQLTLSQRIEQLTAARLRLAE